MVGTAEDAEPFELDESVDSAEDVILLGSRNLSRRPCEGGVALERFVKGFHAPPFLLVLTFSVALEQEGEKGCHEG